MCAGLGLLVSVYRAVRQTRRRVESFHADSKPHTLFNRGENEGDQQSSVRLANGPSTGSVVTDRRDGQTLGNLMASGAS
jgi:hypothetical protein